MSKGPGAGQVPVQSHPGPRGDMLACRPCRSSPDLAGLTENVSLMPCGSHTARRGDTGQTLVAGWVTGIPPSEKECGSNLSQQAITMPGRVAWAPIPALPPPALGTQRPAPSFSPRPLLVKCQLPWKSPRKLAGGTDGRYSASPGSGLRER